MQRSTQPSEPGLLRQLPAPGPGRTGWPWTEEVDPAVYAGRRHWPRISLVTPSWQQGNYLEETIRSVLLQNYPNLEYIVIDGGSTDQSVEIIQKYQPWLSHGVSEPDAGQADAINKGLALATGDVFNWLNSDDYYLAGGLLAVGSHFARHPRTVAFCGREYLIDENYQVQRLTSGSTVLACPVQTMLRAHIDQPPTFFRLDALRQVGPLYAPFHYIFDAELWVRVVGAFGVRHIDRSKVQINCFRLHPESKTMASAAAFAAERQVLLQALTPPASIEDPQVRAHFFPGPKAAAPAVPPLRQFWEEVGFWPPLAALKNGLYRWYFEQQFARGHWDACRQVAHRVNSVTSYDPRLVAKKMAIRFPPRLWRLARQFTYQFRTW